MIFSGGKRKKGGGGLGRWAENTRPSESPDSVVHWRKFSGSFPPWPRPSWARQRQKWGTRTRSPCTSEEGGSECVMLLLANVHTYIQRGWQRASRLSPGDLFPFFGDGSTTSNPVFFYPFFLGPAEPYVPSWPSPPLSPPFLRVSSLSPYILPRFPKARQPFTEYISTPKSKGRRGFLA